MDTTNKTIIWVLAVIVVLLAGYIGMQQYKANKLAEQQQILQQGALFGYQQAVFQLLQEAAKCQPVPITANNLTLNVVAVECFQQTQSNE